MRIVYGMTLMFASIAICCFVVDLTTSTTTTYKVEYQNGTTEIIKEKYKSGKALQNGCFSFQSGVTCGIKRVTVLKTEIE